MTVTPARCLPRVIHSDKTEEKAVDVITKKGGSVPDDVFSRFPPSPVPRLPSREAWITGMEYNISTRPWCQPISKTGFPDDKASAKDPAPSIVIVQPSGFRKARRTDSKANRSRMR
jgi:hypothetical protein